MTVSTGVGRGRPGAASALKFTRKAEWWDRLMLDPEDVWIHASYRIEYKRHSSGGYMQITALCRETGKSVSLPRLILRCPAGFVIDHIDGNTLDNRKSNLRICKQSENRLNTTGKTRRVSRFKGVSRSRDKWRAEICRDGARVHIGVFLTEEDAAKAYDERAAHLHGDFARLNFPRERDVA